MRVPKQKDIEKLLKNSKYKTMRSKEISKHLGMPKEARPVLKKVLRKMVSVGKLKRVNGGRFAVSDLSKKHKQEKTALKPKASLSELLKEGKVLGKYVKTGKTGKVIPKDDKLPHVSLGHNSVRTLKNGSLVVAKLKNKPTHGGSLHGQIVDVLGKAGDLEVEKKGILIEFDMPQSFPGKSLAELEAFQDEIPEREINRRKDLRKETIFTIDGESAKDFDDAVGIYRRRSGYRLLVSIADVSHYVKLGSDIDNEALSRSTSVYMPDQVIPMLPNRLSDDLCSLVADKDRLTKTVEIDFNKRGEVVGSKIYNSVIRSSARLTYTWVSKNINKKGRMSKSERRIINKLKIMNELYEQIKARRNETGELSFELPEPDIIKDELGRTVDIVRTERNTAHCLIEEFMVAANVAVAEFIYKSKLPSVYRIHEPPDQESLNELSEGLRKLGYTLITGEKVHTLDLQRVIDKSSGKRNQLAVIMLILRSLKRAVYSTRPIGHFGLALKHYTHFTSPIRRYPDLIVHRIVESLLRKQSYPLRRASQPLRTYRMEER